MKILAGLFATCLVATPVYAQGDPAPGADTGKPAEGSEPPAEGEPPADDAAVTGTAADAAKPVATTPEPEEAPEGVTPDKPAEPPADTPQG